MTLKIAKNNLFTPDYKYLEPISIKKANITLNALSHHLRRRMLELIFSKEKTTVTDLYLEMKLEQSIVSQHLAVLRRAKIVNTLREGKHIYYSVNKDMIDNLNNTVKSILI